MTCTVLRPTSFMENFAGGFVAKAMATSCRDVLPPDRRLQLIAVKDIGWFAAQALTNPDSDTYKNKSISLAGEELTFAEMDAIYRECTAKAIPTTFSALRWVLFQLVKEMPLTFDFVREEGFGADIAGLRKLNPELTTFKMWVEQNVKSGQPGSSSDVFRRRVVCNTALQGFKTTDLHLLTFLLEYLYVCLTDNAGSERHGSGTVSQRCWSELRIWKAEARMS